MYPRSRSFSLSGSKTVETEKMLVTGSSSFSNNVFKNASYGNLCGIWLKKLDTTLDELYYPQCTNTSYPSPLNPFPNKPWFLRVWSLNLLKTLREKQKLLIMSNFSFSHSVFYPFRELSAIFH